MLDLAVEQALSAALSRISQSFTQVMLEHDIPLEAVIAELVLSGEVERTYRLMREGGHAAQFEHRSPTSRYGQLSRRSRFDHYDVAVTMREIVDGIDSGAFADEWDAERDAGYPELVAMRAAAAGPRSQRSNATSAPASEKAPVPDASVRWSRASVLVVLDLDAQVAEQAQGQRQHLIAGDHDSAHAQAAAHTVES